MMCASRPLPKRRVSRGVKRRCAGMAIKPMLRENASAPGYQSSWTVTQLVVPASSVTGGILSNARGAGWFGPLPGPMKKILKGGGGESTDEGLRENVGFRENNVQGVRAPPPQASPDATKS